MVGVVTASLDIGDEHSTDAEDPASNFFVLLL
jgi:hypothetical protein